MAVPRASAIDAYLAELAARLPATSSSRDILSEARDHLLEAAAKQEAHGIARQAAEREALERFGNVDELAPAFRTVVEVRDARRQARWQLATTGLLGAFGVSVFRLVPLWRGDLAAFMPPPLAAEVAAVTLLWPSLVLLVLSHTPQAWYESTWSAWRRKARGLATWMFAFGLPVCAALVTDQVTLLLSAPRTWLIVGVLGGCLVAVGLVQMSLGVLTAEWSARPPDSDDGRYIGLL
jgi:hypothetical protein